MTDEFTLNVLLLLYAIVTTFLFWFTWRKRPDLRYWFIALIIYTISHVFLIFKQEIDSFVFIGNGIQVVALLVVIISSFYEYYLLMFKTADDKQAVKKEKIILMLTISFSIFTSVLSGISHNHPVSKIIKNILVKNEFNPTVYTVRLNKTRPYQFHDLYNYEEKKWLTQLQHN